jgi:hypothetical protein
MALIKTFYISFFLIVGALPSNEGFSETDCQMKSSVDITKLPGGASVEIKTDGGVAPYYYIFYKESGHLLSEDFKSNSLSNLQEGKYFCTVIDKKNCRNTIEIDIK